MVPRVTIYVSAIHEKEDPAIAVPSCREENQMPLSPHLVLRDGAAATIFWLL